MKFLGRDYLPKKNYEIFGSDLGLSGLGDLQDVVDGAEGVRSASCIKINSPCFTVHQNDQTN